MNTFAPFIALPVVSAGIIGGAALGFAGAANAAATDVQQPNIVATPDVHAHPAPEAIPGHIWHTGVHHLPQFEPGYTR